jgi:hypothetical protein
VKVPALPWRKDRKLLTKLVLETKGKKVDLDKLCYDILKHVDGFKIFPKLAVYNRRQLKVMEHTSRVREAMSAAATQCAEQTVTDRVAVK